MPTKINLLPTELGANKEIVRLVGAIKQLAYVAGALFIMGALGAIGYIFLLTTDLDRINQSKDRLAAGIGNMSQAEQSYFLLKDRLTKAKTITSDTKLLDSLTGLEKLIGTLPAGVVFTEAEFEKNKSEFSFLANNSLGLVTFLSTVVADSEYDKVILKNFSFNQNLGYVVSLEVVE